MDTKLYVGNLSYNTTEDELRELFSEAGTVTSVAVIMDRELGRSKGFAFVEMSSQSEAEQAIKLFDGKTIGNRALKVNIARPREERPAGGGGRSSYDGGGFRGGNDRRGGSNRGSGGGSRRY